MPTSAEVRTTLADVLELDLIGPRPGHRFATEQLPGGDYPSRWYLTGYLVPTGAPEELRLTPDDEDDVDSAEGEDEAEDGAPVPDGKRAIRSLLPSSLGLSVLLGPNTTSLEVTATWGDYRLTKASAGDPPKEVEVWERTPRAETFTIPVPRDGTSGPHPVPTSGGLVIHVSARPVATSTVPAGTRAVSVFLVNERPAGATRREVEEKTAFQAELALDAEAGLLPRPNPRRGDDLDEKVADLLHRDQAVFVTGHGVSGHAESDAGGCHQVRSIWVPRSHVPKVDVATVPGVELNMDTLGALADEAGVRAALGTFGPKYEDWIVLQEATTAAEGLVDQRQKVALMLFERCRRARRRIEAGVDIIATDPVRRRAFCLMNQAMAAVARRRRPGKAPAWHPFQLAFVLMTLAGAGDDTHADREAVDLLYFPTGGGKTEAYLGLAAFVILLRRLRDPSHASDGVAVIMRYTLRLLTIDQLERAAALVCAMELLRRPLTAELGQTPFEVGLWVGGKTSPNKLWDANPKVDTAESRTTAHRRHPKTEPRPIPLERCPWCQKTLGPQAYQLLGPAGRPTDFRVQCTDLDCEFSRDNSWLPVNAIDETLYRRVPCFLVATVDKFASVPLRASTATLFGRVVKRDANGVYPTDDAAPKTALRTDPLRPPELIIQDELHLISGPLGTIAGVYEAAFEALWTQAGVRRPKIVASTATVRRADAQIGALFGRTEVELFPPPGPDRSDCFFARTNPNPEEQRLYLGVAAQGRSLKIVLLRSYLALLGAAQREYRRAKDAGVAPAQNPVDPYMTLVGYFNALRELGGSRRIVEDEVQGRLRSIFFRRRIGDLDPPFQDRDLGELVELTSRVDMADVSVAKVRLDKRHGEAQSVNVALATNMISVGLDITRLGLMVVLGQPKATAEYIQATSRVGRDPSRPGLVVTLHNVHRPRDRSHYEQFEAYHAAFYRAVEATTVTPYAARALDRALPAAVAAFLRQESTTGVPDGAAKDLKRIRGLEAAVKAAFVGRPRPKLSPAEAAALAARLDARVGQVFDDWESVVKDAGSADVNYFRVAGSSVQAVLRSPEASLGEPAGTPRRRLKAAWSMREVEPTVTVLIPASNKAFQSPERVG